jgi:hypothetical protein
MRTLFLSLLALAAFVALPAPATAQGGGGANASVLRASGKGTVHFQGRGHFELRLNEKGTLVIEDAASHVIRLNGVGKAKINAAGEMIVSEFKGTVDIVGQGVEGTFHKARLRMKAKGHGRAVFLGQGVISVDGNAVGNWAPPPGTPVVW